MLLLRFLHGRNVEWAYLMRRVLCCMAVHYATSNHSSKNFNALYYTTLRRISSHGSSVHSNAMYGQTFVFHSSHFGTTYYISFVHISTLCMQSFSYTSFTKNDTMHVTALHCRTLHRIASYSGTFDFTHSSVRRCFSSSLTVLQYVCHGTYISMPSYALRCKSNAHPKMPRTSYPIRSLSVQSHHTHAITSHPILSQLANSPSNFFILSFRLSVCMPIFLYVGLSVRLYFTVFVYLLRTISSALQFRHPCSENTDG
jgi:hypothetical protein